MRTRICLTSTEIFAWGKHGGFGRATRLIGSELAKRGLDVFAVVPRRPGQRAVEAVDGITVLGFPRSGPGAGGSTSVGIFTRGSGGFVQHQRDFATHLR